MRKKSATDLTEEEIKSYVVRKAMKTAKAVGVDRFVWQKKIWRDLEQGVVNPVDELFSLEAQKKKHRERMQELENLKRRREERALERVEGARKRARMSPSTSEEEEEEEEEDDREKINGSSLLDASQSNDKIQVRRTSGPNRALVVVHRPKFTVQVLTGYEWNRYNRTHYDHDNPPPKFVQGYRFNLEYPDLLDKSKCLGYEIEKDDENPTETCILRFRGGPPYQDIAFRIVSKEWELSRKKGFKCEFQGGRLQLHFNFKRFPYRR